MGQYYYVVNLDKKQFLHAHKFDDGLKLMEFGSSGGGTMMALAVLLADGNGRGGGDLNSDNPIIGSWAGDRIVIAGDYANEGKFTDRPNVNLYTLAGASFEDISDKVIDAISEDDYERVSMLERVKSRTGLNPSYPLSPELKKKLQGKGA